MTLNATTSGPRDKVQLDELFSHFILLPNLKSGKIICPGLQAELRVHPHKKHTNTHNVCVFLWQTKIDPKTSLELRTNVFFYLLSISCVPCLDMHMVMKTFTISILGLDKLH